MSNAPAPNIGGKLVLAIFLAALFGFIWAVVGTEGGIDKITGLFGSSDPAPAPEPAPAARKPDTSPAPPKPKTVPNPDPVKPPPAVKPPPTPPRARTFSAVEMSALFSTVDNLVKRGRFFDASNKLKNTSRMRIPKESIRQFAEYERRVGEYNALMRETTKQGYVKMPTLTRILIRGAGRLVVKVLAEDTNAVYYETITGIRSRIDKTRIESMEKLDPPYARVEVRRELQTQAKYKGLTASGSLAKPLTYKPSGGRAVAGLQYFDLADFCARNGLNDELPTLFDEALKRDPNLVTTVHEVKADRMVNVLLYFLSINSGADAQSALDHLKNHYADTRAYRDKVATDTDVKTAIEIILQPAEPLAAATAPPTRPTPVPAKPDTSNPTAKAPTPVPGPKPVIRPVPVPDTRPRPVPKKRVEPNTVPVEATAAVKSLIAKGDRYFEKAMEHLRNSDPNINPDGWGTENKKALDYFMKANGEGYIPAQDQFTNNAAIPKPLLDRVRETTMRSSLCRKRSVSIR